MEPTKNTKPLIKRPNFDIHVAINLNGGELLETIAGPQRVSIKNAFELAQNDQYLWGVYYPQWAQIPDVRSLNRAEFKKAYSKLREYYNRISEDSGIHGRNK